MKRNVNGLLADPRNKLEEVVGLLADSSQRQQNLLGQAFADPKEPFKITNQNALGQAVNGLLSGPLGFAPVGMTKAVGPQSNALETARRNAMEMLGLPANNTATDRAKALGFQDGWFHGTPNPDIRSFDPTRAGQRGADFGHATFATKAPDNASGYSLNWDSFKAAKAVSPEIAAADKERSEILSGIVDAFHAGDKEKVEALKVALSATHKPGQQMYEDFLNYKIPSDGSTVYPMMIRAGELPQVNAGGANYAAVNGRAINEARAAAQPGVIIQNVADNSGRYAGSSDVAAVFQANRLRSRFAAFDPARINDSDLLGRADPYLLGLLGLGAAGGAYARRD